MRYIKKFENILNPEIGDFVIVKIHPNRKRGMDKDIKMFNMVTKLESNVGEIVGIPGKVFDVKFDCLPCDKIDYNEVSDLSRIPNNVKRFGLDEILYLSKDKEELQDKLNAIKFNI